MQGIPDQRRFLYGHLMTCRRCAVESKIFCGDVKQAGEDYREMVRWNDAMHAEFVQYVIRGRLARIGTFTAR